MKEETLGSDQPVSKNMSYTVIDNETDTKKSISSQEELTKFMLIQTVNLFKVSAIMRDFTLDKVSNTPVSLYNNRFTVKKA